MQKREKTSEEICIEYVVEEDIETDGVKAKRGRGLDEMEAVDMPW